MGETVYTETRTFDKIDGQRVLSVDANGGSITVDIKHGAAWLTVQTYTTDSAEVIDFGVNRVYRFTVSGSATYAI